MANSPYGLTTAVSIARIASSIIQASLRHMAPTISEFTKRPKIVDENKGIFL
jgi:hypothetical protein